MAHPQSAQTTEWLRLQKKIFTRWINQKLKPKNIQISDVVTGLATGIPLIRLIEALSETTFTDKIDTNPKMRVHQIDNCRRALDFTFKQGVDMKLKPSADNIVDGAEQQVLGLVWAIMLKFMKLGDEEDEDEKHQMKFADALQMWIANQVAGYKDVKIDNMTKSFHSGLALCALIHHFRPKLIDYSSLSKDKHEENLKTAFAAAEKYFGLEQYLAPSDIPKLDDKSMVVYLSEYYYGIAEARKVDLAARRIAKLITFTKINDKEKADYKEGSVQLREHFEKVFKVLGDHTIDNTMAGARKRLAEFYEFKSKDKGPIYSQYYNLERTYQTLSRRLAHHKRPEYKPDAKCSVSELKESLESMEHQEKERNVALHAELNRQIKLAKIYDVYSKRVVAVRAWIAEKKSYLSAKETILSVGAAQFALNTLSTYNQEAKALTADTIAQMEVAAAELLANKFEHSETVSSNEAEIHAGLKELGELAAHKKDVHEDDLAREIFKAKVRGFNDDHLARYSKLHSFITEKTQYLKEKEDVKSIAVANLQINLLNSYKVEKDAITPSVAPFQEIGANILSAKYETKHSSWCFEHPEEIKKREEFVVESWKELDKLATDKMAVLEDDLARETFKAHVLTENHAHKDKHNQLKRFIEESLVYLEKKEPVNSIADAQLNLTVHHSYQATQKQQAESNVVSLNELGKKILTAVYETKYSKWQFENPQEVKEREKFVSDSFDKLSALSASKLAVLEDDLKREEFKAKLRLWNSQHIDKHDQLKSYFEEQKVYLEKVEPVNSVADAEKNLKIFRAYEAEKGELTKITVTAFKTLGHDILHSKYETSLSKWQWETPDEVTTRETFVDGSWATLDTLAAAKKKVLNDALKREIRKEELRVEWANLAGDFIRYAKDTAAAAASTQFGLVLEEVEAFEKVLTEKDSEIKKRASESKSAYDKVWEELTSLNVTENPYTKLTPKDLEVAQEQLAAAIKERSDAFHKELAKQRQDDALCRELAATIDPFVAKITKTKVEVNDAKADSKDQLEAQIKKVEQLATESKSDTTVSKLKELQAKIDSAGILYNRHTLNTAPDAEVTWTQYNNFLDSKLQLLGEELEHLVMRGVSREQYAEIKSQWTQFDKDKSGWLDKYEFKACLYSLGEERGKKEIIDIMEKLGTGKGKDVKIDYDGFQEFMIQQLGDTDTKDEIIRGWLLINRGSEKINDELALLVLADDDLKYVKSTHGDNYRGWTEAVFSR